MWLKQSSAWRSQRMQWEKRIGVMSTLLLCHPSWPWWSCVTLCVTPYWNSGFTPPLSHSCFQDPCFVSTTFLILVLTFAPLIHFRTPYYLTLTAYPHPPCSYPYSLFSLIVNYHNPISDLLIPPLLHSLPCTVLSSYKSNQCKVESVQISTKLDPLAH